MTTNEIDAFEGAARAAAKAILLTDDLPAGTYQFTIQSPREDDGSYYILRGTVTI